MIITNAYDENDNSLDFNNNNSIIDLMLKADTTKNSESLFDKSISNINVIMYDLNTFIILEKIDNDLFYAGTIHVKNVLDLSTKKFKNNNNELSNAKKEAINNLLYDFFVAFDYLYSISNNIKDIFETHFDICTQLLVLNVCMHVKRIDDIDDMYSFFEKKFISYSDIDKIKSTKKTTYTYKLLFPHYKIRMNISGENISFERYNEKNDKYVNLLKGNIYHLIRDI